MELPGMANGYSSPMYEALPRSYYWRPIPDRVQHQSIGMGDGSRTRGARMASKIQRFTSDDIIIQNHKRYMKLVLHLIALFFLLLGSWIFIIKNFKEAKDDAEQKGAMTAFLVYLLITMMALLTI